MTVAAVFAVFRFAALGGCAALLEEEEELDEELDEDELSTFEVAATGCGVTAGLAGCELTRRRFFPPRMCTVTHSSAVNIEAGCE